MSDSIFPAHQVFFSGIALTKICLYNVILIKDVDILILLDLNSVNCGSKHHRSSSFQEEYVYFFPFEISFSDEKKPVMTFAPN